MEEEVHDVQEEGESPTEEDMGQAKEDTGKRKKRRMVQPKEGTPPAEDSPPRASVPRAEVNKEFRLEGIKNKIRRGEEFSKIKREKKKVGNKRTFYGFEKLKSHVILVRWQNHPETKISHHPKSPISMKENTKSPTSKSPIDKILITGFFFCSGEARPPG